MRKESAFSAGSSEARFTSSAFIFRKRNFIIHCTAILFSSSNQFWPKVTQIRISNVSPSGQQIIHSATFSAPRLNGKADRLERLARARGWSNIKLGTASHRIWDKVSRCPAGCSPVSSVILPHSSALPPFLIHSFYTRWEWETP